MGALDCSFIPKSGAPPYGLDYFSNSSPNRAEQGLEISTLALVDVDYHPAYHLASRQTPKLDNPEETRVDWDLKHLHQDQGVLPPDVAHLWADGYSGKVKFIKGISDLNLHLISHWRHHAKRRWLYHGPQQLRGRRRQYDGKVGLLPQQRNRVENAAEVEKVQAYTAVVYRVHFKRNIRIVDLIKKSLDQKIQTAPLFSTDIELAALKIYRRYKARCQIEFLFRDAKQFTGLLDCQARCQTALHFHFNASMTALNLLKLEDRQLPEGSERSVISIARWKRRKFNDHLLERFSAILGLDFSLIKSNPEFETGGNYGAAAA